MGTMPVVQVAEMVLALVAPSLLFALVVHADRIAEAVLRLLHWLHLLPEPAPRPDDPPIEQVAASLRRLDREAGILPPGTPQSRRRALQLAYDDLLRTACRALAIRHELDDLPPGWDREVERMRVETSLERAGLCIRDRRGRAA
jgi:hypothetical protein